MWRQINLWRPKLLPKKHGPQSRLSFSLYVETAFDIPPMTSYLT